MIYRFFYVGVDCIHPLLLIFKRADAIRPYEVLVILISFYTDTSCLQSDKSAKVSPFGFSGEAKGFLNK